MAQIISFKRDCKTESYGHTPYQRVFYVGYRYVGPMLCQEVQRIYLKKKKFGRYCFQFYAEGMVFELGEFPIKEFSSRLDELNLEEAISNGELVALGWRSDCEVIRFCKRLRWRHRAR